LSCAEIGVLYYSLYILYIFIFLYDNYVKINILVFQSYFYKAVHSFLNHSEILWRNDNLIVMCFPCPPKTDGSYHSQTFFIKPIFFSPFKTVGGKRGRQLSLGRQSAMAVRAEKIITHNKRR